MIGLFFTFSKSLFLLSYFTAVSGTSLYESWVYSSFNIVLGLPIIFFGFLDRDITADFALRHPEVCLIALFNVLKLKLLFFCRLMPQARKIDSSVRKQLAFGFSMLSSMLLFFA